VSLVWLWNPALGFAMGWMGQPYRTSALVYLGLVLVVAALSGGGTIFGVALLLALAPSFTVGATLMGAALGLALNYAGWWIGRRLSDRDER